MKIGFLGTGNMAKAMIKSLAGFQIIASDKNQERLTGVSVNTTLDNIEVMKSSELVFVCVKPSDIENLLLEIKPHLDDHVIVSIAAGVSKSKVKSILGYDKVIRLMPNINCLVGETAGAYSADFDIGNVNGIFQRLGYIIKVNDSEMHDVTALSGSGPAYFATFIGELAKSSALDKKMALSLACKTAVGTARLLEKYTPEEIVKMVSSPNGTTVAGLKEFAIKDAVNKTLAASVKRSKELCP